MILDVVQQFWWWLEEVYETLDEFTVAPNVGIGTALAGFLVLSIVISVFWKGGRG